jgi:hypothetical protein
VFIGLVVRPRLLSSEIESGEHQQHGKSVDKDAQESVADNPPANVFLHFHNVSSQSVARDP